MQDAFTYFSLKTSSNLHQKKRIYKTTNALLQITKAIKRIHAIHAPS